MIAIVTLAILSSGSPAKSEHSTPLWEQLLAERNIEEVDNISDDDYQYTFSLDTHGLIVKLDIASSSILGNKEFLESKNRSSPRHGLLEHTPSFGSYAILGRGHGVYQIQLVDTGFFVEIIASTSFRQNEQGVAEPKYKSDWYVPFFDAVTRYIVSETKAEKLTTSGNDLVGGEVRYKNLVDWVNANGYTYVFDRDNATVLIEKDSSKVLFYAASHHAKVGNEHIKIASTVPTRNGVFFVPESFLQTLGR